MLALVATAWNAGCGQSDPELADAESQPPVITVELEDPEMSKAVEDARLSVEQLIAALENPTPSKTYLGIKAKFVEGEVVEFMWLSDVTFDGDIFAGTVANNPRHLTGVRMMDRREVSPLEIEDWMIIDDGRLVGGYSMRVLAERMSPAERAEMERHMGFTFE
jgi:uncharacterized protein YegJ (DUF2314 family)